MHVAQQQAAVVVMIILDESHSLSCGVYPSVGLNLGGRADILKLAGQAPVLEDCKTIRIKAETLHSQTAAIKGRGRP